MYNRLPISGSSSMVGAATPQHLHHLQALGTGSSRHTATTQAVAASMSKPLAIIAGAGLVLSDHGQVRQIHVTPITRDTMVSADSAPFEAALRVVESRGADAWLMLTGSPEPLSREALFDVLTAGYGGRALLVTCQWKTGVVADVSGIVTCGPASLGTRQWRIACVFTPGHHVPLTLSVLQLAVRFWFATLGTAWPRCVSWRTLQRSVESRRILETALVFHAMGGPSVTKPEFWAGMTTCETRHASLGEVSFGAFGSVLLADLATWGSGGARWVVQRAVELEAAGALAAGTTGLVLQAGTLPIASRGFQHLGPAAREEALGKPVAALLDGIAVSPRAAQERIRTTVSPLPQGHAMDPTPPSAPSSQFSAWLDFSMPADRASNGTNIASEPPSFASNCPSNDTSREFPPTMPVSPSAHLDRSAAFDDHDASPSATVFHASTGTLDSVTQAMSPTASATHRAAKVSTLRTLSTESAAGSATTDLPTPDVRPSTRAVSPSDAHLLPQQRLPPIFFTTPMEEPAVAEDRNGEESFAPGSTSVSPTSLQTDVSDSVSCTRHNSWREPGHFPDDLAAE